MADARLVLSAGTEPASVARQATSAAWQGEAEGWPDRSTVVVAGGTPSYLLISQGFPLRLVNADDPGQQSVLDVI